jgi:hypothetical protein
MVTLPGHTQGSATTDFGLIRSFTFNNLLFRKEGSYSFVISVDDEPVSRLRFAVRARLAEGEPAS